MKYASYAIHNEGYLFIIYHNDVIEKIFNLLHHLSEIIVDRYALEIKCSNGAVLRKNGRDQYLACINSTLRLALLIFL
jgi:hypothetical protein